MPLTSSFSMHLIYASKLFHVKQLQFHQTKRRSILSQSPHQDGHLPAHVQAGANVV